MDETQTTNNDTPEAAESSAADAPRSSTTLLLVLITVLLVGVFVVQLLQLQRSSELTDEVAALSEDVSDLKPLRRDVDLIGDQLAAMDRQFNAAMDATGSSPTAVSSQGADGSLPILEDPGNDPAVRSEMILADISGPEYYSGSEVSYVSGDGKARVWLIWAHWCPYCQSELPGLDAWWPENASRFPNVELVTVSSAIDDSRSNPLLPYLDTEQFDFPVVIDESGAVSQLFGTSAFPFWVVTDGDGRVILRVAGALGIQSVDQIFSQLETMISET